jgi:hypothetical protein
MPAVVDGVDLDAVATAARSCAAVDDLYPGPWGGVVTYLPGRQVPGVRVASDHVVISVRGRWGVPASALADQVRALEAEGQADQAKGNLKEPAERSKTLSKNNARIRIASPA